MHSPEFRDITSPNIESIGAIRDLKNKNFIPNQSPFWWGIDYTPDPRKYLPYEEFQQSLIEIKQDKIISSYGGLNPETGEYIKPYILETPARHFFLYPNSQVPISIINLDIFDQNLFFMVTARPFHPKEIHSNPVEPLLSKYQTASNLKQQFQIEKEPLEHFYPHIRGLISSVRGNNFFWYPINNEFKPYIKSTLFKKNLSYLEIYHIGYEPIF